MDFDSMTPDELRRRCRELVLENETLRRRLASEEDLSRKGPPAAKVGEAPIWNFASSGYARRG